MLFKIPNRTGQPLSRDTVSSLNNRVSPPLDSAHVQDLNNAGANYGRPAGESAGTRPWDNLPETVSIRDTVPSWEAALPVQRQGASRESIPSWQNGTPAPQQSVPARQAVPGQTALPPQSMPPQPLSPAPQAPPSRTPELKIPQLLKPLRKGQKTSFPAQGGGLEKINVCFGWNIRDPRCDMDASAFLVGADGRVAGDEWFVFYGQPNSPDNSVCFFCDKSLRDREMIRVDLRRLNPAVRKIVFVLTINEALEQQLNFSMMKDVYVRLMDADTDREIFSYSLDEYYENVTSMTIGEIYLHNGQWKFNPVGNGVHRDLAGQCAIYGVEVG